MREGWEIKKLGEVCESVSNINWKKISVDTKFPYIDLSAVDRDNSKICEYECINKDNAPSRAKQIVNTGDVIFATTRPLLKRVCLITKPFNHAIASTGFCVLRPTGKVVSKWIYYKLKSDSFYKYIKPLQKGISYPAVTDNEVKNFTIPVPPLSEQEHIVEELDLLSGVIEKKREQLKELDNLAQSIFYDIFGDPITNEKGWEVACVVDVVKMQRGFDLPVQDRDSSGGIPVYGSNGIIARHNISRVDFGIITGRSGTIGEVYVSETPFWPLNTTLFSVDTHGNNVVYLQHLITNYHLERFKAGAGVPTLNRNDFHNKEIIKVPLPLQQSFAAKVEAIEKQKELIKQSLAETETLFNSRMDYYFSEE